MTKQSETYAETIARMHREEAEKAFRFSSALYRMAGVMDAFFDGDGVPLEESKGIATLEYIGLRFREILRDVEVKAS